MSAKTLDSIPASADSVTLIAFTVGWLTLPLAFFLDGEEGKIKVPCTAFLIRHPTKGLALFDTGLGPRFERPAGTPAKGLADLEDDGTMAARLRAIGVDPTEIRWIINSHLHSDHAGGNAYFTNASVIIQAAELDYARAGTDRAYHVPEFDIGQPFERVNGEHDMFGDGSVVLFPSPGHTPGHQCARVRTAGGTIVLAADCCNLKRSLDEMRLPDHVFNADQAMDTLRMLKSMRDQGTRIFYGHDPDFWETVPKGVALA